MASLTRVKIIATVGPATGSYEIIKRLISEGVSCFRINYSHGEPKIWDEWISYIRDASAELDTIVSIMGDLPGPQIRIGDIKPLEIHTKDKILLVLGNSASEEKTVPIPIKKVFETLEIGDLVLLDDGKIMLRIEDVSENQAVAMALNDGVLLPHKTLVIHGKEINLPSLTERDVQYVKYSVNKDITFLALSYVRTSKDVEVIRDLVDRLTKNPLKLVAKIETRSAVNNLRSIIGASDAVIIARGDLGMHYPLEELPFLQKRIAYLSLKYGKPSIVATQLLETMVNYPRPSRSEVVDVMNAVMDLIDALLLTNETAVGKYPIETIRWLKRIVRIAEANINKTNIESIRTDSASTLREKYALGLTLLAEHINAKILVYTKTGTIPSLISRYRPQVDVYAGSTDHRISEELTIRYGIRPYRIKVVEEDKRIDYDKGVQLLYNLLRQIGEIEYGDIIAEAYGRKETEIHSIKIRQVI